MDARGKTISVRRARRPKRTWGPRRALPGNKPLLRPKPDCTRLRRIRHSPHRGHLRVHIRVRSVPEIAPTALAPPLGQKSSRPTTAATQSAVVRRPRATLGPFGPAVGARLCAFTDRTQRARRPDAIVTAFRSRRRRAQSLRPGNPLASVQPAATVREYRPEIPARQPVVRPPAPARGIVGNGEPTTTETVSGRYACERINRLSKRRDRLRPSPRLKGDANSTMSVRKPKVFRNLPSSGATTNYRPARVRFRGAASEDRDRT